MIRHHPADELLFDLASGAQPAALALAVAAHVELCAECRRTLAACEVAGGAMLAGIDPAPLSEDALDTCLARLDAALPAPAPGPCAAGDGRVPPVLRPHLRACLDDLRWRSVGGLFDEVLLDPLTPGFRVSMLRAAPGRHVPEHGHEGNEYMLVLAGGYTSGGRHYVRGDFSACDGSEEHMPVADQGEDCIRLLVLDGPLAFRDAEGHRIGPLLSP